MSRSLDHDKTTLVSGEAAGTRIEPINGLMDYFNSSNKEAELLAFQLQSLNSCLHDLGLKAFSS